jgi:hypothetical protein
MPEPLFFEPRRVLSGSEPGQCGYMLPCDVRKRMYVVLDPPAALTNS